MHVLWTGKKLCINVLLCDVEEDQLDSRYE